MNPINNLKSVIFHQKLKSEIRKQKRSSKVRNPRECKSFLILFDADDKEATSSVLKLEHDLILEGKKITLAAYSQRKDIPSTSFTVLTNKDVNWYGVPVSNQNTENLLTKEWDCILSLHTSPIPALDYIAATGKAATKAGFYHNNLSALDIMLDPSNTDFKKSLDQLMNILQTIKSRSYEPVV